MPEKRINLFGLLRNENRLEKVLVFPAIKREIDPTEHLTSKEFLNPITIEALVQQISFEALRWKYIGQLPQDSIQIICELRYENILKLASKIEINGNSYKCYQDDGQEFKILKRSDYLVAILERKNI